MWKIIFTIQKTDSMLINFQHRKLLGACLITISLSLDCISNERIKRLHIALLAHWDPATEVNLAHIKNANHDVNCWYSIAGVWHYLRPLPVFT